MVKHFDDARWAEFARELVSPNEKAEMQRHIDGGCRKCGDALQVWQDVLLVTSVEVEFTPPADVVRIVKSQLSALLPGASHGVRLLFDSRLQPVTAGIRGSVAAGQFLYETDQFYIDLRLEPRRGTGRACVVGQLLPQKGTQSTTEGVPVRVQQGRLPLAETVANRFGEFQLEFDAVGDLYVSVGENESNAILLPLYGLYVE